MTSPDGSASPESPPPNPSPLDSAPLDSAPLDSAPPAFISSEDTNAVRAILAASRVASDEGLGPSVWIRDTDPSNTNTPGNGFRWRYPALDDLLGRSDDAAVDWDSFVTDSNTTVAATAAMALARLGRRPPAEPLAAAVRDPTLPFEMRCAAAEALCAAAEALSAAAEEPSAAAEGPSAAAKEPSATAESLSVVAEVPHTAAEKRRVSEGSDGVKAIRDLLAQYGNETPQGRRSYVPELHAELIRALAAHVDPRRDESINEALRARSSEVRLAAVTAVAGAEPNENRPIPQGAVDARLDGNPAVRAVAIRAILRHNHPKKLEYAAKALKDMQRAPRTAAIAALGELSDDASLALLDEVMQTRGELDRVAATEAMSRRGAKKSLLAATEDKSARVRMAAARGLAAYPDPAGLEAARRFLKDPSGQVRAEAVGAAAQWPLKQAGPVLLDAMALRTTAARRAAAFALADRWPPAREFPVDADAEDREAALSTLRRRYGEEIGFPAEMAVAAEAPRPPRVEEMAAAAELASSDRDVRRLAARTLQQLANDAPLHAETINRLVAAVLREDDALLWHAALEIVAEDDSEDAARLAVGGLGHPDPEVRRRACVYLGAHPDPSRLSLLADRLGDKSESVVAAAVTALGAAGPDPGPAAQGALEQLLGNPNELFQVEAAAVLAEWKVRSGFRGLERAALSDAPTVRRRAAEAMGATGDPAFLPYLIRLLDDRQHIRLAALAALSKTIGDTEPGITDTLTTTEKITRWKTWYEVERGAHSASRRETNRRE